MTDTGGSNHTLRDDRLNGLTPQCPASQDAALKPIDEASLLHRWGLSEAVVFMVSAEPLREPVSSVQHLLPGLRPELLLGTGVSPVRVQGSAKYSRWAWPDCGGILAVRPKPAVRLARPPHPFLYGRYRTFHTGRSRPGTGRIER